MTRRQIFGFLGGVAAAGRFNPGRAADSKMASGIKLGVATYSFREFQRKMALSYISQLGVSYVSVKDFHLSYHSSPEEFTRAKNEFKKAGVTIASVGNTDLKDENPAVLKRYFEYARNCGSPMIIAAPTHKTLPAVEKLAKEFNIQVAIHTHGPEDPHFPSPKVVLDAVRGMDPRMGLCLDLGHSMRTGADVVQEIANAGPRLLDLHIKDLKEKLVKESQCAVGEGVMPVVAIFKQLKKIDYNGCVNLEYEIKSEDPIPGMQHSLGYMRGVLAALA